MKASVPLKEAKELMSGWSQGSFRTVAASIRYHFGAHGAEVGTTQVWQYLRRADAFRRNLRGASRNYLEGGKTRYTKKGRYVILDENSRIISWGAEG